MLGLRLESGTCIPATVTRRLMRLKRREPMRGWESHFQLGVWAVAPRIALIVAAMILPVAGVAIFLPASFLPRAKWG